MKLTVPTGQRLRFNPPALLDDVQTAAAYAFGLRLLRSQHVGPLIRLRRASDSAELDFNPDLITTRLDLDAIAVWAGGDSFIVTWYDQSGNGRDVIQATAASQPKFIAVHANGRPGILWNTTQELQRAGTTLTHPLEASWVFETSLPAVAAYIFDSERAPRNAVFFDSSGRMGLFAGLTLNGSIDRTDGATHYVGGQFNGASSVSRLDGAQEASGDVGSADLDGLTLGQRQAGPTLGLNGHLFEFILFDALLSDSERDTAERNQAHYYGLPIFILDRLATAPAACYGLRRLLVAYNGPLVRLRRSSDSQEKDFSARPGNLLGLLNTVEIAAWAGGTAFVVTWYDQSGNSEDVTQSTAARQPQFVADKNGRPGMLFDPTSSTSMSLINDTLTTTQPNETHIVGEFPGTASTSAYMLDGSSSGPQQLYMPVTTAVRLATPTILHVVSGITFGETFYMSFQADNTSSLIRRDGSQIGTGTTGTDDLDGLRIGNSRFLAHAFGGHVFEVVVFDPVLATGDRTVLEADYAQHFGVS